MKNLYLFFLGLLLPVLVIPLVVFAFVEEMDVDFDVTVRIADCVVNGVCEPALGEDYNICAADCPFGCNSNSICESHYGEDNSNCVDDCPVCNSNSICEAGIGENTTTCPADCPLPVCNNNGTCDVGSGETTSNCPNDCVVEPAPAAGGGGMVILGPAAQIKNLLIKQIDFSSIKFSWDTDILANCYLYWGRDSFNLEKNSENDYLLQHNFVVDRLSPNVDYYGRINCFNTNRVESQIDNIAFRLSAPVLVPQTDFGINNLQAISEDSAVGLSWQPLNDSAYQGVVIRRSNIFFPTNINEGGILYSGKGQLLSNGRYFYRDLNLVNGQLYFYSLFAIDDVGNYLPAVSASAIPKSAEMLEPILELPVPPTNLTPELSLPLPLEPLLVAPQFRNFVFNEQGHILRFVENIIEMPPNTTVEVLLNVKKIPNGTKNIVFTTDEKGVYNTYFMEKTKDGDFRLKFVTPSKTASQRGYFTYLNKDNQAIARVSGRLFINEKIVAQPAFATTTLALSEIVPIGVSEVVGNIFQYWYYWIWWILILLFFWIKHWFDRL